MPKPCRLLGLSQADAHPERMEFTFTLAAENKTFDFTTSLAVVEQMVSALAHLAKEVRDKQPAGEPQVVAAEEVHQYFVRRDPWTDCILLRFVNPHSVPYTFSISAAAAGEIADELKSESAKKSQVGRA